MAAYKPIEAGDVPRDLEWTVSPFSSAEALIRFGDHAVGEHTDGALYMAVLEGGVETVWRREPCPEQDRWKRTGDDR